MLCISFNAIFQGNEVKFEYHGTREINTVNILQYQYKGKLYTNNSCITYTTNHSLCLPLTDDGSNDLFRTEVGVVTDVNNTTKFQRIPNTTLVFPGEGKINHSIH